MIKNFLKTMAFGMLCLSTSLAYAYNNADLEAVKAGNSCIQIIADLHENSSNTGNSRHPAADLKT